jgi:4-amino-4-deoxy-L-arabinose transferase-like glycosyltransferase
LFCATLPSGILASSGAKNDYFLALWLVAAVYFATRLARSPNWSDTLAVGGALGLSLLTKATAYLFAPWLLAAVLLGNLRRLPKQLLAIWACALLLNLPHYARNLQLSGSPLGFDSAHGDGFFRWRNETFGFRQTASNILRNLSEQLGGRSDRRNREVYATVVKAHQWVGIDINDPATTWRWSTFEPPRNANHEANANSRWHLLILAIAAAIALWRALRGKSRTPALYTLALLGAFLAFCFYLKWQPYEARLLLPLLVAGSPIVGLMLSRWIVLEAVLCLFLLSTARLPVLQNWTRPLRGPTSVFRVPRDQQYFADMVQWGNRATYEATLHVLSQSNCDTIGFDITNLPLEYPLMALLRERQPLARFVHTGVGNVSRRYRAPVDALPCAVVCFDCAGDRSREMLYGAFPRKIAVDKFLIFEQGPRQ